MTKNRIKELLKKLRDLQKESDTEARHIKADKLLLEYIDDEEVKKAFDNLHKWYA